jgi:hypothetical protein
MRHGPRNSPNDTRSRPTPPDGIDPARAGIHALDCGEEEEPPTTIIRRAPADDDAAAAASRAVAPRDEQQQSI